MPSFTFTSWRLSPGTPFAWRLKSLAFSLLAAIELVQLPLMFAAEGLPLGVLVSLQLLTVGTWLAAFGFVSPLLKRSLGSMPLFHLTSLELVTAICLVRQGGRQIRPASSNPGTKYVDLAVLFARQMRGGHRAHRSEVETRHRTAGRLLDIADRNAEVHDVACNNLEPRGVVGMFEDQCVARRQQDMPS